MQPRLVKSIRSTLVTRVEVSDPTEDLSDVECAALQRVTEKFRPELSLRTSGFSPQEIRRLEFIRWSLDHGRER